MKQEQKLKSRRWLKWLALIMLLAFGIWQLNVSKPGTEIIGCPVDCALEVEALQTEPLHILSFNMLHGFPDFTYLEQRTTLLMQEIGRLDLDIVLLQEVPWTKEHGHIAQKLAQQGGFNYAYLRANGNRALIGFEEGSVILSRYPLTNMSFTELRPPATFYENRIVIHATVEGPQGPVDLFVTHLTHGKDTVNEAQTESLIAFVQEEAMYPAIVAGDFNAVEDSPQIMKLANIWQDSYRLAHPDDSGETCCVTNLINSSANELQTRVDYLFLMPTAKQTFNVIDIQRLFAEPFETANGRLWLSDHAGLLATIAIESQP